MDRRSALWTLGAVSVLRGQDRPLRLAMTGLVHGHARGFFNRNQKRSDIQLVGVAEADEAVRSRYFRELKLDPSLSFPSIDAMLEKTRPEGVLIYTNTFDHRDAVKKCLARGLPVMMEKPLAVSVEHAREMQRESKRTGVPVLVNYETTWYASNAAAYQLARSGKIGELRKFVVHDGHQGPKEIKTPPEFFAWLSDPVKNGAGALFDFGCYGANLITWLMDNQRPISVTAVTQQNKPEIYAKVDDEATVILRYPKAQGILQASWNWPFNRKDMEVYGATGYVHTVAAEGLKVRLPKGDETQSTASPLAAPEDDPLNYFAAVIRQKIAPAGLSSLENNMIVTEILDAARRSAASGRTVRLG